LQLDAGPALELAPPSSGGGAAFDNLDLSSPSAPPVRFDQAPRAPNARTSPGPAPAAPGPLALELEGDKADEPPKPAKRPAKARPALDAGTSARQRASRRKLAVAGALAVVLLG